MRIHLYSDSRPGQVPPMSALAIRGTCDTTPSQDIAIAGGQHKHKLKHGLLVVSPLDVCTPWLADWSDK